MRRIHCCVAALGMVASHELEMMESGVIKAALESDCRTCRSLEVCFLAGTTDVQIDSGTYILRQMATMRATPPWLEVE